MFIKTAANLQRKHNRHHSSGRRQASALPDTQMDRSPNNPVNPMQLSPTNVLALQQTMGNRTVQQIIEGKSRKPMLQKQSLGDAGVNADADAGTTASTPLSSFDVDMYLQDGEDFDAAYTPVGPEPQIGELEIVHRVHIHFKPFTRAMMRQQPYRDYHFTPEQRRDFAWTDDERQTFTDDFIRSASGAWSGQYLMRLNETGFSPYRSQVRVRFELSATPDNAHTRISAQKIPAGAPRLRSFVQGDEATLDIRDPSEPDDTKEVAQERPFIRQVGAFGFDSSELTSLLELQVDKIDALLELAELQPDANTRDWELHIIGAASAEGRQSYNKDLGQQRAETVKENITADTSWVKEVKVDSIGETNTAREERFRMVMVSLRTSDKTLMFQDSAAHEAGHMLGLGDEYVDTAPDERRFPGDEPDHYEDVQDEVGYGEANELLTINSDSIMSTGNDVRPGHYIYFLRVLREMTGKNGWEIIH